MALPVREQLKYWGIAAAILLLVLWLLGDVIMPFILGAAIAYILDPIADRLERLGMNRAWATILITLGALLAFVAVLLLIVPPLVRQTAALIDAAPEAAAAFELFLRERFPFITENESVIREQLLRLGATVQARGGELLNGLLASVGGIVDTVILFVIVPVVTFYLLIDWDRMVAQLDALLPRDHAPTIRRLAGEVDRTMSGFIRGQGTVCLILGTYYAVALMLIGLEFGLVVGFVAGLISFIPYVGALVGGVMAIGLALVQFWGDWLWIVGVAAIFQVGQLVEGNVLTPNLVGGSVGLHPVWLIFALTAFGTLFGFVGLLLAVPLAAALGVLTRFAIERYRESQLYQGVDNG